MPFVDGARKEFEDTLREVKKTFHNLPEVKIMYKDHSTT
jgi:hypothetical protein